MFTVDPARMRRLVDGGHSRVGDDGGAVRHDARSRDGAHGGARDGTVIHTAGARASRRPLRPDAALRRIGRYPSGDHGTDAALYGRPEAVSSPRAPSPLEGAIRTVIATIRSASPWRGAS